MCVGVVCVVVPCEKPILIKFQSKRSQRSCVVRHKDQGAELFRLDVASAAELSISLRSEIEQTNPNVKGLSFLYSSYEPRCWWFEVFVTS